MTKVDIKRLDSVTKNDTTATAQINDNFTALQEAIENTLSRDGTGPNYMDADLDMNSYRIINSSDPVDDNDIVNLRYVEERIGGAIDAANSASASASQAASSAQSALVSSTNAINTLRNAENTINQATELLTDTQEYVDAAKADIDDTVEAGKQEINTTIDEAQMDLSDTITQATDDVKDAAVQAAEGVIADVESDLRTGLQPLVTEAGDYASLSRTWATGTDDEVQAVEPDEHSSRGYADLAMAIANTPEDVPVDISTLLALDVIKGPKGDKGDSWNGGAITNSINVVNDSNHPIQITGMAGASATGYQIIDSNGLGDSDFEHYATGDRYGTRITNHNNTSDTSVNVDLYQTNVGRSVLDATAVDTVMVKDLQVDGADVVKTSGDQTIEGYKTFSRNVYLEQGQNDKLFLKDTRVDASSSTGTDTFNTIIFRDKNNFNYSNVAVYDGADGRKRTRFLVANKLTDGTTKSEQIWIQVAKDGTVTTYAPTPPASNNSTQIATTAWVNTFCKTTNKTVIETYQNGTNWYRKWSDGWIEQGGRGKATSGVGFETITLLKPMLNTSYTLLNCNNINGSRGDQRDAYIVSSTQIAVGYDNPPSTGSIWYVCGQGA